MPVHLKIFGNCTENAMLWRFSKFRGVHMQTTGTHFLYK